MEYVIGAVILLWILVGLFFLIVAFDDGPWPLILWLTVTVGFAGAVWYERTHPDYTHYYVEYPNGQTDLYDADDIYEVVDDLPEGRYTITVDEWEDGVQPANPPTTQIGG